MRIDAPGIGSDQSNDYEALLAALMHGDRRAAYGAIDRTLDRGHTLRDLYLRVVQPAMVEIGRLWQQNDITVADEHLAMSITQAAMGRAFERQYRWHESRHRSLIAACVEEENHQVGLQMLCDLLELEGWDTAYLGASVPTESLVAMIEQRRPAAIALSVTMTPNLPRLRTAIEAIRQRPITSQPLIIVGGRAFADEPDLWSRLGADVTASDAGAAVELLCERFA